MLVYAGCWWQQNAQIKFSAQKKEQQNVHKKTTFEEKNKPIYSRTDLLAAFHFGVKPSINRHFIHCGSDFGQLCDIEHFKKRWNSHQKICFRLNDIRLLFPMLRLRFMHISNIVHISVSSSFFFFSSYSNETNLMSKCGAFFFRHGVWIIVQFFIITTSHLKMLNNFSLTSTAIGLTPSTRLRSTFHSGRMAVRNDHHFIWWAQRKNEKSNSKKKYTQTEQHRPNIIPHANKNMSKTAREKNSLNRRHSTCSHQWFDVMQSQLNAPIPATTQYTRRTNENKTNHKNCLCAFALAMINNITLIKGLYNGTRRCCMPNISETLCTNRKRWNLLWKIKWNALGNSFAFRVCCDRIRRLLEAQCFFA